MALTGPISRQSLEGRADPIPRGRAIASDLSLDYEMNAPHAGNIVVSAFELAECPTDQHRPQFVECFLLGFTEGPSTFYTGDSRNVSGRIVRATNEGMGKGDVSP